MTAKDIVVGMEPSTPPELDEQTQQTIRKLEEQLAQGKWRFFLNRLPMIAGMVLGYFVLFAFIIRNPEFTKIGMWSGVIGTLVGAIALPITWKLLHRRLDDLRSGRIRLPNRDIQEAWSLNGMGMIACVAASASLRGDGRVIAPPMAVMLMIAGLVLMAWGSLKYTREVLRTEPALRDKNISGFWAGFFWVSLSLQVFVCGGAYVNAMK